MRKARAMKTLPSSGHPPSVPATSTRRRSRPRAVSLLSLVVVAIALAACQPAPPHNAATSYVTGGAYGASATLTAPAGLGASLAPVAGQGMPCNPTSNATYQNQVATTDVAIP